MGKVLQEEKTAEEIKRKRAKLEKGDGRNIFHRKHKRRELKNERKKIKERGKIKRLSR